MVAERGRASAREIDRDRKLKGGYVQLFTVDDAALNAITIVNHPELLLEEYDEIAAIDYENRDLQRLWSTVLTFAAESAAEISRAERRPVSLEEVGLAPTPPNG